MSYSNSKRKDRLRFFYRDEIFTSKFLGGDYLIRNDYEKSKLSPKDKVVEDSEVILRGPDPLPELGDLGRLSRLIGLFLDRIADMREVFHECFDTYEIDVESILYIANYLGLPGLDKDNWNVEMQQRFLRIMQVILKRGGTAKSYSNLARLLGFMTVGDHLVARRRWDSVVYNSLYDPMTQPIPLDTMGSMDTYHETYPLALLRWRFYKTSSKSYTGSFATGTQLLTDASAQFSSTAKIGNLIVAFKQAGYIETTFHTIEQVKSDTVIKVDPDFSANGTNMVYKNLWEVPMQDPFVEYLLERFNDIAPAAMKTMHRDEML